MIFCLADDLTGLAEVATQAAERGIPGRLYPDLNTLPGGVWEERDPLSPVSFVNLGCRATKPAEAGQTLRRFVERVGVEKIEKLYLKVDSVARGPVGALVETLFEVFGPRTVPLLLGNPLQNRIVRQGTLYVGGKPAHESEFARDPLHPLEESFLPQLLSLGRGIRTVVDHADPDEGSAKALICLDCATAEDAENHARRWRRTRTAAGAAPFGVALLAEWKHTGSRIPEAPRWNPPHFAETLGVIGTRHSAGVLLSNGFSEKGGTVLTLGESRDKVLLPLLLRTPETSSDPYQVLEGVGREAVSLVRRLEPKNLIVFGGETAQFLARRLGIRVLEPVTYRERVAALRVVPAEETLFRGAFLMTPGSYSRPDLWRKLFV